MTESRTEDFLETYDASSLGRHVKLDMETRLGFASVFQDRTMGASSPSTASFKYVIPWLICNARRSGRYAPILLAPAEGWGALWALIGAFGPS